MKAVIQSYRTGELEIADVPAPALKPEGVLVRTGASLVSAGTEKLMVDLAKKSLLGKARERPDLVRQVVQKIGRDGLLPTIETVQRKLDTPITLGYSSAGTVIAIGAQAEGFAAGDRVACAGAGYAAHAEIVYVPRNLAVKVPDSVDDESGAFTTLGAIAMQGIRLAEPQLGETAVVIGLGLLGLLSVQMLAAAGCRVLGMDTDLERCSVALRLGVENAATSGEELADIVGRATGGHGADRVLITAGTRSNEPVSLAGEVARPNGAVVVVGAVGMDLPRKPYFDKELVFRVSRSYGPGRYDPEYEEKGRDYPFGFVRWTENRNMAAFVQLLARGKVNVKPLVTHRFEITRALEAYSLISSERKEPYLGIVLSYPGEPAPVVRLATSESKPIAVAGEKRGVAVGFLGAGSFATGMLIPAMRKVPGISLVGVCTATGVSARHTGAKFGFRYATTDERQVLDDPDINTAVIGTRHNLHGRQTLAALETGKHVFVEKPLCMNREELDAIAAAYASRPSPQLLMVGYNRRFAPMAVKMKKFISAAGEPLVMHYRVNAGYIPLGHWVHDPEQGGGRIVGEVCHFVDFLIYLCGALPVRVSAASLPNGGRYRDDNVSVLLDFTDGSVGTITYAANGDKAFPKEYVEAYGGGCVAILDNFRRLSLWHRGKSSTVRAPFSQDKGHRGEWEAFARAIGTPGAPVPIPFDQVRASTEAVFAILESLRTRSPVRLNSTEPRSNDA